MAIELRFSKSDDGPWGFRLTGGKNFDVPLTVVKISENGPAKCAGLQVGDVIIHVNGNDTSEMSHEAAQDAIHQAGPDLFVGIFRGELSDLQVSLISEEEENEEVFNILEGSIPIDYPERPYPNEEIAEEAVKCSNDFNQHDLNLTDEDIRRIINPEQIIEQAATTISAESEVETEILEQKMQENIESNEEIVVNEEIQVVRNATEMVNGVIDEVAALVNGVEMDATIENNIESEIVCNKEYGILMDNTQDVNVAQITLEEQQAKMWSSQVNIQEAYGEEKSEVLKAVNSYLSEMAMEAKKWSTFLQKPKGPKPITKEEQLKPKQSTYRVKIRTRRDLENEKVELKAAEEAAIAAEIAAVEAAERAAEEEAARLIEEAIKEEEAAREAEIIAEAKIRFMNEESIEVLEGGDDDNNNNEEDVELDEDDYSRSEATSKHMSGKEAVLTVEQQLAQVKEQLLCLSELPTTIQNTLKIITEQLQKLAVEAQPFTEEENDNQLSNADNTETEDEVTEQLNFDPEEVLSVVDEESEAIHQEATGEETMEDHEDVEVGATMEVVVDEEAEAKRLEQVKQDKIEKVQHWNQIWPWTRVTQPIYRINFLKYQPPPKNLDHLMNSDVYKMVHDMDPPPRGIIARPEKILAEDDYVTQNGCDEGLHRQMER